MKGCQPHNAITEWSRNYNCICYVSQLALPRSETASLKTETLLMRATREGNRKAKQ